MTDTFRALCAELLSALEREGYAHWVNGPDEDDLCLRARAVLALADEPAVPEGREPAAVNGQPSDEELLDIAASAIDPYACRGIAIDEYEPETEAAVEAYGSELIAFARAVLARWDNPVPAPPADGEVAELVAWLREEVEAARRDGYDVLAYKLTRAAELLQRQALVPVSERPWEREGWCDAEGRCWWGTPGFVNSYTVAQSAQWRLSTPDDRFGSELLCLPAHALPLPEVSNG